VSDPARTIGPVPHDSMSCGVNPIVRSGSDRNANAPGLGGLRYQILQGAAIGEQLPTLAALRLEIFRDWPYLYEGTLDYERQYLDTYIRCPQGLAVLAWDGTHCVGATTALPLSQAEAPMQQPFLQAGMAIDDTLYFGESVVLESHRGRGIGVAFFAQREAHAQALGLRQCAFCAVDRPALHPLKPAHYVPNDGFWTRRGYTRHPELRCTLEWLDRGDTAPTPHTLTYWLRRL